MGNSLPDVLGNWVIRFLPRPHQIRKGSPEVVVVRLEVHDYVLCFDPQNLADVIRWCLAHFPLV